MEFEFEYCNNKIKIKYNLDKHIIALHPIN